MPSQTPPLCVDLDGTLIKSDLLVESILVLLKQNLLYLFVMPLWLLSGKAKFKQHIAMRVDLDISTLPYDERVLELLRTQKAAGRRLVLTTASDEKYARQVAAELNLFDEVIASTNDINLDGRRKQQRLSTAFGAHGYDYAGNAAADLHIWPHARHAIVVDAPAWVVRRARAQSDVQQVFERRKNPVTSLIKAMRPHQWLKNVLVFVPLLAAHRIDEWPMLLKAASAFLAFGLCASSAYLLNDLLDLRADRKHPRKRLRPFAAGEADLVQGLLASALMLLAAFSLALLIEPLFALALGSYYLLTLLYSFKLKERVMVDVMALATLYTLRIVAGAVAVSVIPSFWLLAFSMFLFLSLAMVKRYAELSVLELAGDSEAHGRGYRTSDQALVYSLGGASGYLSVLVLALYINSESGSALYRHPEAIWLLCPLLLYWISRIWFKAFRDQMHDDPLVFALRDRVSQSLVPICAVIIWAAI